MKEEMKTVIEEYAEGVRELYNIGIPFSNNNYVFLEKLGGRLKLEKVNGWDYSELCLSTTVGAEKFIIKVLPSCRKEIINFESAKQIGHLFLHTTFVSTLNNSSKALLFTKDIYKANSGIQANEFAYNLLMPRHEFIQEVHKNTKNNLVNMKCVADKFEVSLDVVQVRARTLNLIK